MTCTLIIHKLLHHLRFSNQEFIGFYKTITLRETLPSQTIPCLCRPIISDVQWLHLNGVLKVRTANLWALGWREGVMSVMAGRLSCFCSSEVFRLCCEEVDMFSCGCDVCVCELNTSCSIENIYVCCWLCFTSHRQRGHLETAPPFTVPCKGREARFLHPSHWELNPRPSRGSPLHYHCAMPAPLYVCIINIQVPHEVKINVH